MILVIDNYDSFTYNLVHIVGTLTNDIRVVRNDEVTVDDIKELAPTRILLSPGPGRPADAGIMPTLINDLGSTIPMLGICLGHQAIGEAFGGTITYAPTLMHGKTSLIYHRNTGLFEGLPQGFIATRYHSLVVDRDSLPECLEITAETEDGVIMGFRHREFPLEGIQFHPESILTTEGPKLVKAWVGQPLAEQVQK